MALSSIKEVLNVYAPIERIFRSIEGEGSRIGEVTTFVKLGDGPYRCNLEVFADLRALGPSNTLVIQTSNVTFTDWRPFVSEFVSAALASQGMKVIHETRGDLLGPKIPTYVWLTPGVTTVMPAQLFPEHDDLKMLVHDEAGLRKTIEHLLPWAEAGFQCFIFPRVPVSELAPFFRLFLDMNPPPNIRMMTLEHEVIGID
jgi:hypothetical protein